MRILSFSVLAVLLVPNLAAAQTPEASRQVDPLNARPQHSITLNVLPLLINVIDVNYEHLLTPDLSVLAGAGVKVPGTPTLLGFMYEGTWAAKAGVGMRWYVAGRAPTGFFVSPGAQVFVAPQYHHVGGGINAMIGGAWLVANRFHMSASGGVQYLIGNNGFTRRGLGFVPAVQVSMGPAY